MEWIPYITAADTDSMWIVYGYNVQEYLYSLGYRLIPTANDFLYVWRR